MAQNRTYLFVMVHRWAFTVGALLATVSLLAGCGLYHKRFEVDPKVAEHVNYVLQLDDVGKFWDMRDAERALLEIQTSAKTTNTIVVTFIHGWHHNASASDPNLKDFKESIEALRTQLGTPLYAESRRRLTGISDVRVIGIYVGWRGRSLPAWADYATFWSRKAAAERVGEGDFREFMLRLNRIYEQSNPSIERSEWEMIKNGQARSPFMGLVSFGHSFGGQVLFRATQPILEANLVAAGAKMVFKKDVEREKVRDPLKGFGDIVVLINPALEALQYDRIDRLSRTLEYDRLQPPLLFVISATTDSARSLWFPLGRAADAALRADLRPEVRDMWGQALGSYVPQQTHEVTIVGDPQEGWKFDPEDAYKTDSCKVINADLTSNPEFLTNESRGEDSPHREGVVMKRLEHREHAYAPFVVANVPIPKAGVAALVDGHNEIWKSVFETFLTNYIAITQGKRILIRRSAQDECAVLPVRP